MENAKINLVPPNKSTPGFARRLRRVAAFQKKMADREQSEEMVDEMINFLAEFCTCDVPAADIKEVLWDASEEQFSQMLSAVAGGGSEVPPVNGAPSTAP
jgi:hypothetical protein